MTRYTKQNKIELGDYVVVKKNIKTFAYGESPEMKEARKNQKQGKVTCIMPNIIVVSFRLYEDWNYAPEELTIVRKGVKNG